MNCKNLLSKILVACLLFFSAEAHAKILLPPPNPTTDFDFMDFPPVYPTYSWEVLPNTEFYQIQVLSGDKVIRELKNSEALDRMTDSQPFIEPGYFSWRVRAVDKKNRPLSDWSVKKFFRVSMPVHFAVLGDSISHGGAAFIPAGQLSCQWQTFCNVPIKNIARSGDTTAMMIERFEQDVLPFKPKVLLILGGVNDIREGKSSAEVIKNFETLREKCLANNITPIFGTLTPMNEKILRGRGIFLTESDWRSEREKINAWILENGGVDVSSELCDEDGELNEKFTYDGLHPALRGKKFMGEAIEKFLRSEKFVRTDS